MAKRLLSLVLVATQLVSWNASPLYLCVGSEGSVCIDLGSENCNCCPVSADLRSLCATACAHHVAGAQSGCTRQAHEHDEDQSAAGHHDNYVWSATCECTHIQLLYPLGPVVVRGRAADQSRPAHHFLAPACCLPDGACGAAFAAHSPPLDPLPHAPFGLIARASVVLQC